MSTPSVEKRSMEARATTTSSGFSPRSSSKALGRTDNIATEEKDETDSNALASGGLFSTGIRFEPGTSEGTVFKNKVRGADTGIDMEGNDHTLEKNMVKDSGQDGISVGSDMTLEKNGVMQSGGDGIRLDSNNTLEKNRAKNSGGVDLRIVGTGNTLDKDKFDTCDDGGSGECP